MRKLLISILLATVAASPAIARPQHDDGDKNHPQAHEQHQQAHDEGRGNRGGGDNRPQFQARQQVQVQQNANRGGWDRGRFEGRGNVAPQQVQVQEQVYGRRGGNYEGYRGDRNFSGVHQQQVVEGQRNWSRDRTNWNQNRDGDWRQRGTVQVQSRDRSRWANGGWNRNWRNDRRYDWRNYRNHHRSAFHLGIYYDPFGYGYRAFDIGYRLQPGYFGQQYWIDPAMYGLPFPPPGAQWVRYWNDAVLVDMYSGEVIDVIHDFFW